ncbi:MAG: ATP-binding cassette domain-containing protein [Bacteroidales bacterium]|nr:ATP-binding cassette domain-containing protein [Bacteroidales bacterium]
MSEALLKALMQLFAFVISIDCKKTAALTIDVLEDYLHHDFGAEQTNMFLSKFQEYIRAYRLEQKNNEDEAIKSETVKQFIDSVNAEFEQNQKVWLILQVVEFMGDSKISSPERIEFVKDVASGFNIREYEFENGKDFILSSDNSQIPWNQQVLLIDSNKDFPASEIKHLTNDHLNGKIYTLRITSTNTLLIKYFGESELFLNSRVIKPGRTYIFGVGSVIRGARVSPIYYSKVASAFIQDPNRPFVSMVIKDIEYQHKGSKNGIYKFSLTAHSGQLIGIMGGSGVGKSTLLNLLNGNLKPATGQVLINGYDVHQNKSELEGVIGYVPQDDLMVEELTVYQNLYYNASLCFSNFDIEKLDELIDRTLRDFDLVEARDLRVGDPLNKYISGGQRKRLNMAMELMREPSVLFVDEPTSGLSSMDSERIMLLLKKQTFKGKIVFANIHQPSSDIFKLFDKIVVLDQGGRPIFQGNPMDAVVYFKKAANFLKPEESECITCGNVNTDLILKVVEARVVNEYGKLTRKRKRSAKEWYELYLNNIENKLNIYLPPSESPIPPNNFKIPSHRKQMWIYFKRNLQSKLANTQFINISILAAPILAVIIGYFTKYIHGTLANPNAYLFNENDNIPSFLFMSVVAMIFLGLTVSAEEIIKDRKILYREKFLNLSYFSYINSKIIVLLIFSAIQSLLFVVIGHGILEFKSMFWSHWLILFSTAFCSNLIGLNLSAALNSVVAIYVLIPIVLVPQLLFSGVIVNYNKLHKRISHQEYVPFIGDIMLSRWSYEALCVQQFKTNRYDREFFDYNMQMSNSSYNATLLIPKLQSLLDEVMVDLTLNKQTPRIRRDLSVIRNEIAILAENYPISDFNYPDTSRLNTRTTTIDYITSVKQTLDTLKNHFNINYRKTVMERDKHIKALSEKWGSSDAVFDLNRKYHNKNLEALVTNRNDFQKIELVNDRLIRRLEPIYSLPSSKIGRAQLFSAYKRIGQYYIPTLWFNVVIIWIMSGVFYLALWSDMFRMVNTFVERFRFRKLAARISRYLPS